MDPDLELGGGPGFHSLTRLAFLFSVICSLFTQNKEGARAPWAHPLDPPLTTCHDYNFSRGLVSYRIKVVSVAQINLEWIIQPYYTILK